VVASLSPVISIRARRAGFPFAEKYLRFDGHPSTVYVKATDNRVNEVHNLLAAQANPENPTGVDVSLPSQALVAQADAKQAFNTLFFGLGAVALLVGAIGVANIMVIAVLERRSEIGLRRALGATRGHIRTQFLTEAVLLALIGGVVGVLAGAAATAIYSHHKGWATVLPAGALGRRPGGGLGDRRPGRTAPGHPRRPDVPHPGPLDPMRNEGQPGRYRSRRARSGAERVRRDLIRRRIRRGGGRS
jgi:putative ABC transport system permease protein